jgi:hypothetical protein
VNYLLNVHSTIHGKPTIYFLLNFVSELWLNLKCLSRYAMRAIYIAKGSPLLPPDFVSIFDDLASSSLDVFFDPSHGLANLPGLTLGI